MVFSLPKTYIGKGSKTIRILIVIQVLAAIALSLNLLKFRSTLLPLQTNVRRARETINTLNKTSQALVSAENAVQGYVLHDTLSLESGNYLLEYQQFRILFLKQLGSLGELMTQDSQQRQAFFELDSAGRSRLQLLEQTIVLASANQKNIAISLSQGEARMAQFRDLLTVIELAETLKIENGIKHYDKLLTKQLLLIKVLAGVLILIVLTTLYDIQQVFKREAEALCLAEQEVVALELAADERAKAIAAIAHDVKHYLHPILFGSEMIERYFVAVPTSVPRWINQIKESVERIDRLAIDAVLVSQSEAGKLEADLAELDLVILVRSIVAVQSQKASEHSLCFSVVNEPRTVRADVDLCDRAITNLIENAIKYSPNKGLIYTRIEFGDQVSILVADQGLGISDDVRSRLFDAFQRSDNVGSIQGFGLGLAVVKACAQAHGGSVAVSSGGGITLVGCDAVFSTVFTLSF